MPRKKAPDSEKQARVYDAADVLYGETGNFPTVDDVAQKAKMSSRDIKIFFNQWKANQMAAATTFRLSKEAQEGLDSLKADAEQLLKTEIAWLIKDHEAAILVLRNQYMADIQKDAEAFGERIAELETKNEYLQAQLFEYKAENGKLKAELTEARALNISKDVLSEILQQLKQPHVQPDVIPDTPIEEPEKAAA